MASVYMKLYKGNKFPAKVRKKDMRLNCFPFAGKCKYYIYARAFKTNARINRL